MAEPVIEVRDFEARYGDDVVLRGIDFEVNKGEIFVILGGSGCGKSTLLKHLIGLYKPYRGRILIQGRDMVKLEGRELSQMQRRFGVLYQSGALWGSMTLAENVALPLEEFTRLPKPIIDTVVRVKLAMVGLAGYESRLPDELSGGMRKRAGLARAMALDPEILFFDEPQAGLDPVTCAGLDDLIVQINRSLGTTMVIVSHELESVLHVAHRVIMLDKKRKTIIAEGDPRRLRDQSTDRYVCDFFNRQPERLDAAYGEEDGAGS